MSTHDHATTHHIVPLRVYYLVFGALLVLLGLTYAVYLADWGVWSIVLGVLIAVVKALLIIFYFMHVRYSPRLVLLFALSGFIWLAILIGPVIGDYVSRGWLPTPGK